MQKLVPSLVAACLIALVATGASAQSVWKWRDASGQIHISDAPPPTDVPEKNILKRPGSAPAPAAATEAAPQAAASASAAASGVDSELQKRKAKAEKADKEKADKDAADKAALEKKNAAIKADNCQRAQTSAKALESGVRIARINASGEREYLDDKQRADELKRAQDSVAQNCK
jgi:hypothetical protein